MKSLIFLLLTTFLFSRTIVIEEEEIETSGLTFYILTMCKDGYQYTGIHKGNVLDFKIVQDFEELQKEKSPIECNMDFKDNSQLEK